MESRGMEWARNHENGMKSEEVLNNLVHDIYYKRNFEWNCHNVSTHDFFHDEKCE